MNHRLLRICTAIPIAGLLVFASGAHSGTGVKTARAFDITKINKALRGHISGFAAYELSPTNSESNQNDANNYFPRGSDSCPVNLSSNIKVNQNCLNVADPTLQGRSQAQNETSMAQDPNNPNHMIATYNDYRRGDGNCYGSYSLDKGRTWNDTTIPMSFTRGRATGPEDQNPGFGAARQYWQAGGDTSVAWDSKGNAYFSCQVFNRGNPPTSNIDQSSALLVFRSTQNNGASWNFPGRYVTAENDLAGAGTVLEDKQLLTADSNPIACPETTPLPRNCTPFQDRVYVTWTEFTATTAYIYEAFSSDYGEHFSPRHLVSPAGTSSTLCAIPLNAGGGCDNNQFSQPFVAPDGTLYVVWANYNTIDFGNAQAAPARFQVLLSKSVDGGNTFTPPTHVSDFYELPDCPTYQGKDPFRACVPEKGVGTDSYFRASNYPVGAVNPANPNLVAVSIGSYISAHSNEGNGCVPVGTSPDSGGGLYTGVKTPGACNNDILLSLSTDAGTTFPNGTEPRTEQTVTQDAGQATTDQWFQWLAFNKNGKLAVSYYDRQYGTDETTGFSDFSLSGSGDYANFAVLRVTSGSMPPPTQFSGNFWGDYTGLAAVDNAYPLWSDTRDPDLFVCPGTATAGNPPALCGRQDSNGPANDQDIFTAALPVPSK